MARTIASAIDQVQAQELSVEQVRTNPMANIWLGILAVCLGGTLLCTAVLVAWPIIANLIGG